jgi:hypothetical protein
MTEEAGGGRMATENSKVRVLSQLGEGKVIRVRIQR